MAILGNHNAMPYQKDNNNASYFRSRWYNKPVGEVTEWLMVPLSKFAIRHLNQRFYVQNRTFVSTLIHNGEFSFIPLYFLDSMTSHILSPAATDLRTFICPFCPKKALIQLLSKFIIASHNSLLVPSMPSGHFAPLK